jgi:SAM-dependent methyltransferase
VAKFIVLNKAIVGQNGMTEESSFLTRFTFDTNSMIEGIRSGFSFVDDRLLDKYLYPEKLAHLSRLHWTPLEVALRAAKWLSPTGNENILDIGSGVGKFCLLGALTTNACYTGVELRKDLHSIADNIIRSFSIPRVRLIQGDIANIDFAAYNAFYFFNSFEENIHPAYGIDDRIPLTEERYKFYTSKVKLALSKMPPQTRLVTYCVLKDIPPPGYIKEKTDFDGKLVLWVKQ